MNTKHLLVFLLFAATVPGIQAGFVKKTALYGCGLFAGWQSLNILAHKKTLPTASFLESSDHSWYPALHKIKEAFLASKISLNNGWTVVKKHIQPIFPADLKKARVDIDQKIVYESAALRAEQVAEVERLRKKFEEQAELIAQINAAITKLNQERSESIKQLIEELKKKERE